MNRPHNRRPAVVVALAVAAVTASLALTACKSSTVASGSAPVARAGSSTPAAAASPSTAPSATPAASASPSAPSSPAPPAPPKPATLKKLRFGDHGSTVLSLQKQLTALGYWLGHPDGHFSTTTQQAVFALQKAAHISPTGVVNTATWKALNAGVRPAAKSTSGHVIEVNLARDLVMFVTNGHVDFTINTSTGGGYVFFDQGVRNVAITPKGHYKTYRVIDGSHRSTLGLLWRPRYFVGGIAIHGDSYVPAHPVSHGCVRVTDAAMNWIWATKLDPIGTSVWVY